MNKKRILTGATAAAFVLTSAFGALGAEGVKPMYHVNVNGAYVEDAQVFVDGDNTVMLPLRAVTEEMGFTVAWNADTRLIELTRGAVYVTLTQDVDGYTFARTAPMKLGKAPVTIDDRTYVPESFIDEILMGEIAIETNGDINITYGDTEKQSTTDDQPASPTATITEIGVEVIVVDDAVKGPVRLGITDETVITDVDGKPLTMADLKVGMLLSVEYSETMGLSEPPFNAPIAIRVLPPLDEGMLVTPEVNGDVLQSVSAVLDVDTKEGWVLINDGQRDVCLNVVEDTELIGADGKEIKLDAMKKDVVVSATYSAMMTRSLPPQSAAISIVLTDMKPEDIEKQPEFMALSGKVVEVTEDQIAVLPKDKEDDVMNYVVLNVGDKTVFQDDAGKAIARKDIKAGDSVFVRHAMMMTMSIPPQTPAFVVELDKNGEDNIDDTKIDVEAFFAEDAE